MSGKSKYNQSSKSASSKKIRRERDISPGLPHSEFPAITSTFSGLAGAILIALFSVFLGINNTYASSISISLADNVSLYLLKDNTNPTFGKSTTQTATITSDHYTGYTLTIAGSDDTGRLVGANNPSNYLESITSPVLDDATFNTDTYNNKWGFLPGTLYNSSTSTAVTNTSYQLSPTTTPTTIDVTTSPTTSAGTVYTLALGARIDSTMALDSYSQTFILAATGNGYDYFVSYTDDLNDMPENQEATNVSSTYINLSSSTPTKSGYTFAGWCDQKTTNNGTTCPGNTYTAGERIDLDGASANHYDLHAIWDPTTFAEAGATNMQSMTTAICNAVAVGQEATLSDTRGGSYRVGKMKDGKCWMLDNLALGSSSSTIALTPDNTNITANWTLPKSVTSGFTTYTDALINVAYNSTVPQGDDPLKTQAAAGSWKVGTYYNYCAATAGTYCPAAGSASGPVTQDICPKGWRMPSGGPGGEYQVIYNAYGNYTNFRTALKLPLSGSYYSAQVYNQGSGGRWWSSTFYNGNLMYGLGSDTSGIYPQNANHRLNGFSMRCVAK